jgi:hypothetical protein
MPLSDTLQLAGIGHDGWTALIRRRQAATGVSASATLQLVHADLDLSTPSPLPVPRSE